MSPARDININDCISVLRSCCRHFAKPRRSIIFDPLNWRWHRPKRWILSFLCQRWAILRNGSITSLSTRDTPSATGDKLTPPLLSLHYTILVTITTHNTAGFGLGAAFVSFTDTDVVSWSTTGNASVIPALIEWIEDVNTTLFQMHLRMTNSTVADKIIYENTKKNMIQGATVTLFIFLIKSTWVSRRIQESWKSCGIHNTPRYFWCDPYDTDAAVLQVFNACRTAAVLEVCRHFDYTSIFKIARTAIATDVANDPRPFDMTRFHAHKKNIDTALLAANFQEIKPPLSVVGSLHTMVTDPAAALITRSTRSSHSQGTATGPSIICFHCNKPGHTVPNWPTKKTLVSFQLTEKCKTVYILASETHRTVRVAENRENAESALLTMAESVPAIQYDTNTDNEQDEDDDNEN